MTSAVAVASGSPPGVLAPELAAALAAIDALAAVDPVLLADGDAVVALAGIENQLAAVACRQAAEFELHGEWRQTGAQKSAMWPMVECRQRKAVPFRRCRTGRWLRTATHVRAAFLAGDITEDHVDVLRRAAEHNDDTFRAFEKAEANMVDWAKAMRFADFSHAVDLWRLHADPIGADGDAKRQRDQRAVHLSESLDGMWFLDGLLDPVSGSIIDTALQNITDELWATDWAKAKQRLRRDPKPSELAQLTRTPAQRRADALVEMATRSHAVPAGARRPEPLITILVGEDTFRRTCQLVSGKVITPGTIVPWLSDAAIERIIFDSPDRVLSVSHQRFFTAAVRRAIEVRDRRCTHPYCDRPAAGCEADHIHPHGQGGETSQTNGQILCPFHHRQRTARQTGKRNDSSRDGNSDDDGDESAH